jgi:leucyl-tRNA synthetase
VQDEIEYVLQVNGKLRGSVKVPAGADAAAIEAAALATPSFAKFSEGRPVRKVVLPPGRSSSTSSLMAGRRRLLFASRGRARRLRLRAAARARDALSHHRARRLQPRSPLADELRTQINSSPTTTVVETTAQAQVVLEALSDARERSVVASTATGQVRELQLRTRLQFRAAHARGPRAHPGHRAGAEPRHELQRGAGAGQGAGGSVSVRAMQSDIVAQVMRRLAAVKAI